MISKYKKLLAGAFVSKARDTYLDRHSETGVPVKRHFYDVTMPDKQVHRCRTRGAAEFLASLTNGNATPAGTNRMKDFHFREDYAQ